jgi:hypothetical protein
VAAAARGEVTQCLHAEDPVWGTNDVLSLIQEDTLCSCANTSLPAISIELPSSEAAMGGIYGKSVTIKSSGE